MKEILIFIEKQLKGNATLLFAIATVVFFALFVNQCKETDHLKDQAENTADFLNSEISYYQNELDQEVAEKNALYGQKESLEVLLSDQIDSTNQLRGLLKSLRKVKAAGNITQSTKIERVQIDFEEPVAFDFIRNWSVKNEWYSITGTSTNQFTRINELEINNTLSFAIGVESVGFWKTEYKAKAVNSNKLVKTTGLDTYTFASKIKRFGIGPYIGLDIITLQPSFGISAHFNLVRF